MDRAGRDSDAAMFAQALAALKRKGSNLLLVGSAYEDAHLAVSRRLLGTDEAPRSRLFVVSDGRPPGERDLATLDPTTIRTLTTGSLTRGASAGTTEPPAVNGGRARSRGLADLEADILASIRELEAARGGFEPAELRICVDSLLPVLEEFEEEEYLEFLRAVTTAAREAGAMTHYHLPVEPDIEIVDRLRPLFEAVVELRSTPEGPRHRWRLSDEDVTTGWLPI